MPRKKTRAIAAEPSAPDQMDASTGALPRNPNGAINNCALACGYPAAECQMCMGKCPDAPKFDASGFPIIVPCTPSAARNMRGEPLSAEERTVPLFAGIDPAMGIDETAFVTLREEGTDRRRSVGSVVEIREIEARNIITLESDALEWDPSLSSVDGPFWKGALVRLRPPPTASDEDVERVRKAVELAGAERVIALPRPKGSTVPSRLLASSERKRTTARQAVAELVAEANTKNREALAKLCDLVMGRNGL